MKKLYKKALKYKIIATLNIAPDTYVIFRNSKYEIRYSFARGGGEYFGMSLIDRRKEEQVCRIKTVSQFKLVRQLLFRDHEGNKK